MAGDVTRSKRVDPAPIAASIATGAAVVANIAALAAALVAARTALALSAIGAGFDRLLATRAPIV